MHAKEKRTERQLQRIILEEARRHPECRRVADVAITRGEGSDWGALPIWSHVTRSADCKRLLDDFVNQLRTKYELS